MDNSSSSAVVAGPLAGFEVSLRADLERCGYAPSTIKNVIATMARLSGWMQRMDIAAEQLSPSVLEPGSTEKGWLEPVSLTRKVPSYLG